MSEIKLCMECKKVILSGESEQQYCDVCSSLGINKICENVFLSDCYTAHKYSLLKELEIERILQIGKSLPPHKTSDFDVVHIEADDVCTEDLSQYFYPAAEYIDESTTLVHCRAGISRSATIVIAYLMIKKHMSLIDAYKLCKEKRSIIRPNDGFIKQLQKLDDKLFHEEYDVI